MAKRAKMNSVETSKPAERQTRLGATAAEGSSTQKVDLPAAMAASAEARGEGQHPRPSQLNWHQLAILTEQDSRAAYQRWSDVMYEARHELDSGQRAAAAVQLLDTPWEQAQFLAIRQSLAEEWQPTRGLEDRLIDMMAHSFEAWLFWMKRSTTRANLEAHAEARSIGE